jgi:hypothetical protein
MQIDNIRTKYHKRTTEGEIHSDPVLDQKTHQLLGRIIDELKIMNMHLAILSDEIITKEDTNHAR